MNQRNSLARLRARIIDELFVQGWREVWFFPSWDGVKGWQGTDRIMFVGLNPSGGGHFPSRADRGFYNQLRSRGFTNAHLTDVVKVKATGREVSAVLQNKALMHLNRRYICEEVEILRPHLVVALGRKTHSLLRQWLPEVPGERVILLHHYSWAYRYRHERRFAQEMGKIRRLLRRMRGGSRTTSPDLQALSLQKA